MLVFLAVGPLAAAPIPLLAPAGAPDRYLVIRRLQETVNYSRKNQPARPAVLGDKLVRPGDQIETGLDSGATLVFDDGIASLRVSESTTVTLSLLDLLPDGGKRSRISVRGGQVALSVRRFNRKSSKLEIDTPAGVAGVRGTIFGVAVDRRDRSTIAARSGVVSASAQGQTLLLPGGLESLVPLGKPPQPPVATPTAARIYRVSYERLADNQVRLSAYTDPGNLVRLFNEPIDTDLQGNFSFVRPLPADRFLPVEITTALGAQRTFNLTVLLP